MKLPKIQPRWVLAFGMAIPACAVGYVVGGNIAEPDFWGAIRTSLGIDETIVLNVPTLIAAGFYIFLSLLQAILLGVARFSKAVSQVTGIEAQFGDGKKGRRSFLPLAWFHGANGIFLMLLAYLTIQNLAGEEVLLAGGVGLACGAIMIFSALRCWQLLDELLRQTWVEATAMSCGITLIIGMFVALCASLEVIKPATTFQAILAYNYIYLVTYVVITVARAPETLTDPNLEAQ